MNLLIEVSETPTWVSLLTRLASVVCRRAAVNLIKDGGEQYKEEYKAVNPLQLIPALVLEDQKAFVVLFCFLNEPLTILVPLTCDLTQLMNAHI